MPPRTLTLVLGNVYGDNLSVGQLPGYRVRSCRPLSYPQARCRSDAFDYIELQIEVDILWLDVIKLRLISINLWLDVIKLWLNSIKLWLNVIKLWLDLIEP